MNVEANFNILVITGTTSIPVLIANRMLKYGYQMMQVQGIPDVLRLPEVPEYFGVGIISIDGHIAKDEIQEIISGISRMYPKLEFIVCNHGMPSDFVDTSIIDVIDIISFPYETEMLISRIFEVMPCNIPPARLGLDAVTQIHLPPIEELDVLPFDVFIFLPLNNKAILYKKAGQRGFQRDLNRITLNKNAPIFIRRGDFAEYSKYLSQYMINSDEDKMPQRVRVQVMQKRFTSIMRSFFSQANSLPAEESQAMLDSVRKIASDFVQMNSESPVLHDRIRMLIGRSINNYAHAMNVSAYCTIFGLMAGLDDTDSLSLGGLFHDIGLSELPAELALKDYEEIEAEEERELYLSHGKAGVDMIEKRNIPISHEVKVMIEQHHYLMVPGGAEKIEEEIHPFARICALADVFDELTSVRSGKKVYSPFEAIQRITGMSEEHPNPHPCFEPELHEPIIQQFLLEALNKADTLLEEAASSSKTNVIDEMMNDDESGTSH